MAVPERPNDAENQQTFSSRSQEHDERTIPNPRPPHGERAPPHHRQNDGQYFGPEDEEKHERYGLPRNNDSYDDGSDNERKYITNEWRDFRAGQVVDMLDSSNVWCEAEIRKVGPREVYVLPIYWNRRTDEKIPIASHRLAPHGSKTFIEGGVLRAGQRVEVQRDSIWNEAKVLEEALRRVKVLVFTKTSQEEEWLDRTSNRIAPYGRNLKPHIHNYYTEKHRAVSKGPGPLGSEHHTRMLQISNPNYVRYCLALERLNLRVYPIEGDGNCLFRSVSHQIYGDDQYHMLVRQSCMNYMEVEKDYFKPYVVGDMSDFMRYLEIKRRNAVWGDDPEIQAMCELYNRPAQIFAFDAREGARLLRTFHEASSADRPPIRLSYYGGGHYDSVVGADFARNVIREEPGVVEDRQIEFSRSRQRRGGSGDREAISAALEASRKEFGNQHDQDVETAMMESLNDYDEQILREIETQELQAAAKDSELVAMQSEIVSRIQEQSEAEDMEKAIKASLETVPHPSVGTDDDDALYIAIQESLASSHPKRSEGQSSHPTAATEGNRAPATSAVSSDLELATVLAASLQGQEDDDIQRAINLSLQQFQ